MAAFSKHTNEYHRILADLENGKIAPLYFAMGSDYYLYRQFVKRLSTAFRTRFGENAGFTQRWGADLKAVTDVSTLLGGGGLFSSATLIMLHEIQDSGAQVKTKLSQLLGNLPPDTVVLVHYSISDYRRAKWLDAMQNISQVVGLQSPEGSALSSMVAHIAEHHKVRINEAGIYRLIELSSGELAIIDNEIEKLSLYLDDPTFTIDQDLVDKVAGAVENAQVNQLIDAFSKRDRQSAIHILVQINHQGKEGLPYLVAMLYNRLTQLMALQENPEARKSIGQGATSYYFLKDLTAFGRNYTLPELQQATRALADLDIKFRLGSVDMLSAFTTWVSKVV